MIVRKYQFIALAFLGLCLSPLLSCAPAGSGLQSYAPVAAQAPGMARVWFLRTKDPQEQFGDPIIYANGNQLGRRPYRESRSTTIFRPGLIPSRCRATV